MKDFFKNVLANIVAILLLCGVFFFLMICIIAIGSAFDSGKTTVKDGSVLVLDQKTNIIDSPTESNSDFLDFDKDKQEVLIYDVLQAIHKAKDDDKIKGISLEADMLNAGITQIDDIRAALEDFKKSGKFVYAYGNGVSQSSYYLGSVAQQYFLNPAGGVELKGLSTEVTYLKDFIDKYGIGVEVMRHGKYKSAVEPVLLNDMSEENRLQLTTLLGDIWTNTSSKIMASRKIDSASFRLTVDSLYSMIPENNLKYRFADKLLQKSEYDNFLKTKLNQKPDDKLKKVTVANYINSYDDKKSGGEVAVLYASGNIVNGDEYDGIQSRRYVKEIQKLQKDDKVKAVVLRVNSPGGSANAADEILFELKQLRTQKPLVISFGDYAASGGYYIAMAGEKIFSEPNTVTGSIGVFGIIPNAKVLAERNGIHAVDVKTNANSNMVSMLNGVTPGAKAMINKSIEGTYRRFVGFVMENRKKTFQQVDELGGGRVWSGVRAKANGLVDENGTLEDAVKYAAGKAKLKDYQVNAYPKKRSKFEQLFKNMDEEDIAAKIISKKIGIDNYNEIKIFFSANAFNNIMMHSGVRVKMD